MSEQQPQKDHFLLYIAGLTLVVVGVIVAVKLSENEKFAPIKQQLQEESAQMNIRVISTTE
jgi:carbonic anhydrase